MRMLGKRPPVHDDRTLKLANYLDTAALPPLPHGVNWTLKVKSWGVMKNDFCGDCAVACPGHMEMAWTSWAGNLFIPTDQQVIAEYSAISGYDPSQTDQNGNNPTDVGCNVLDVLKRWRTVGLFGRKCGAFVQVNPQNHQHVQYATYLFGGVYFGFALPAAWKTANVWKAPIHGPLWGQWQPGSWGGHAVPGVEYDGTGIKVVTWGGLMDCSWRAVDCYADECYAIISPDWIRNTGLAPSGVNMAALIADLQAVAA